MERPPTTDDDYQLQQTNYGFSDPDVILRPPITNQPSVTSQASAPWSYTPSATLHYSTSRTSQTSEVLPPEMPNRTNVYGSVTSVYNECNIRSPVESQNSSASKNSNPGSREWSRGLAGAFRDARMETKLSTGLKQCKHFYCSYE